MFPVGTSTLPHTSQATRDDRVERASLANLLLDGKCSLDAAAKSVPTLLMNAEGKSLTCPVGFEQKVQENTLRIYYVDHITRNTAWNDPRQHADATADQQGTGVGDVEAELQQLCSAVLPEQACLSSAHRARASRAHPFPPGPLTATSRVAQCGRIRLRQSLAARHLSFAMERDTKGAGAECARRWPHR